MISNKEFSKKIRNEYDDSDSSLSEPKEKESKENEEENEVIININSTTSEESFNLLECRKLLMSLSKQVTCDAIYKVKEYLVKSNPKELETIRKEVVKVFFLVHKHIESNLQDGTLYNVFKSYKDLLIEVKKNEKLQKVFDMKSDILNKFIELMDETMKDTIQRQEKMKKSRKNLKEKLRLQRRLNEMRNICSAMDENTVKDEKKEGMIDKDEEEEN